jgi:hypothetical protein
MRRAKRDSILVAGVGSMPVRRVAAHFRFLHVPTIAIQSPLAAFTTPAIASILPANAFSP